MDCRVRARAGEGRMAARKPPKAPGPGSGAYFIKKNGSPYSRFFRKSPADRRMGAVNGAQGRSAVSVFYQEVREKLDTENRHGLLSVSGEGV